MLHCKNKGHPPGTKDGVAKILHNGAQAAREAMAKTVVPPQSHIRYSRGAGRRASRILPAIRKKREEVLEDRPA